MSVGLAAIFPWQAIIDLGIEVPPCAFVLTDSRVTDKRGPINHVRLAKQRIFSNNLIVCYTSSNVSVTTGALDQVAGAPTTKGTGSMSTARDIRRIGQFLQKDHTRFGGITELITIVWQKYRIVPEMFEVMPPAYQPNPRQRGIGIGDGRVLQRFKEVLRDPPPGVLQRIESAKLLKQYAKLFAKLPPGATLRIIGSFEGSAEVEIAAALSQAIEEVASIGVGFLFK